MSRRQFDLVLLLVGGAALSACAPTAPATHGTAEPAEIVRNTSPPATADAAKALQPFGCWALNKPISAPSGNTTVSIPSDALTIGLDKEAGCPLEVTRYPERIPGPNTLIVWGVTLPDVPGDVTIANGLGSDWAADDDPRVPGFVVLESEGEVEVSSGVVRALSRADGVVRGTYELTLVDGRKFQGEFEVLFVDHAGRSPG